MRKHYPEALAPKEVPEHDSTDRKTFQKYTSGCPWYILLFGIYALMSERFRIRNQEREASSSCACFNLLSGLLARLRFCNPKYFLRDPGNTTEVNCYGLQAVKFLNSQRKIRNSERSHLVAREISTIFEFIGTYILGSDCGLGMRRDVDVNFFVNLSFIKARETT